MLFHIFHIKLLRNDKPFHLSLNMSHPAWIYTVPWIRLGRTFLRELWEWQQWFNDSKSVLSFSQLLRKSQFQKMQGTVYDPSYSFQHLIYFHIKTWYMLKLILYHIVHANYYNRLPAESHFVDTQDVYNVCMKNNCS